MQTTGMPRVFEELGLRRIINARGNSTILGGSVVTPKVQRAMEEANDSYVDMEELLDKSGRAIADLLGIESAYVTSGCFSALAIGAAAIMTGKDLERIARLPDTTGCKNEFLIQKRMRYRYDRSVTVPGGRLIEVGDEKGTTAGQLEGAIGPKTAGILYLAQAEGEAGNLSIPQVVEIARAKGVAVLVDAASEVYPLDRMTSLPKSGADLVCFGAKYMGSTHSSGILCGRRDRVEAAVLNGFVAYEAQESHSFGRGFKVDRQEIIATVVALQEWLTTNHEERLQVQEQRIGVIARALTGLPHVKLERLWERQGPWMKLRISLDEMPAEKSATLVERALKESDPSIWVRVEGDDILVAVHPLREGEEQVVAERLQELLSS